MRCRAARHGASGRRPAAKTARLPPPPPFQALLFARRLAGLPPVVADVPCAHAVALHAKRLHDHLRAVLGRAELRRLRELVAHALHGYCRMPPFLVVGLLQYSRKSAFLQDRHRAPVISPMIVSLAAAKPSRPEIRRIGRMCLHSFPVDTRTRCRYKTRSCRLPSWRTRRRRPPTPRATGIRSSRPA